MFKLLFLIVMLSFISNTNAQQLTQEAYLEQAKYIWKNFVPKSGQSEFVQGELLRAIEKLRDEAQRNGNGNFNNKCHTALISYLRTRLSDTQLFDPINIRQINRDLDQLNFETQPYLDDDIYDRINDRIVDWYLFYGKAIKHEKNPDLKS